MSNQPRQGYLLSGVSALGGGTAFDNRMAHNYSYLVVQSVGASSIVHVRVSHDSTAWMIQSTHTAATAVTATAQIAGYFPYVQGYISAVYSGGAGTGRPIVYWAPGLQP